VKLVVGGNGCKFFVGDLHPKRVVALVAVGLDLQALLCRRAGDQLDDGAALRGAGRELADGD